MASTLSSGLSCVIVPSYRAAATVCDVISSALEYVDLVFVVDDACPENSGEVVTSFFSDNPAVTVIRHDTNRGVGGAMKTGFGAALAAEASVIIKLDSDGQMDPAYIPDILEAFDHDPSIALVKGNRFSTSAVLRDMPRSRLFGNAMLTIATKITSGYWNVLDPTNGYIALRTSALRAINWGSLPNDYFFEIGLLSELGTRQLPIAEIAMLPRYKGEVSSLSIPRVLAQFPPKLFNATARRLALQYLIFDVNVGTLYMIAGVLLIALACVFGGYEWYDSSRTGIPRTSGTVMLAALPFIFGTQLLLNAVMYDVQFSPRVTRLTGVPAKSSKSNRKTPQHTRGR